MSNAPAAAPAEEAPVKKGPGLIVWILAAVVSGGIGFAVPRFLPSGEHAPVEGEDSHASSEGHADGHGDATADSSGSDIAFVPYGDIVVNLDEGKLNRYLRLRIVLQCPKKEVEPVNKAMEAQRIVLKNWLLSYLSDKEISDIRGAAGQGMLRREIQEYFNTTMFPDGKDRIYDVLFDEFNIQ
jgi:flagellar FliL protein